ncbi:hypothetical protein CE143_09535 [Photorhabdus luminescens]|uniref:2OG-Fe dioxygenase family protein n=1 Tax=Photorhabdus akhurstii TaxID=171438 RepID=A0ABX8LTV8_9GAMM|nr:MULTISPECIES: 2OG-Fe dioxygenase family protein [Photorhabdus]MCC8457692.1 2OG-Fe dioxygenase family protein [Photorhabdus aegyptia]QXF33365.1 hypothetical protein B0X70_09620 [Photorhabdus akhurstii]UJD75161.1 hypothetical protein CE143_09535 [Photorhabdus luminescens]
MGWNIFTNAPDSYHLTSAHIRNSLHQQGFATFNAADLDLSDSEKIDLISLCELSKSLPLDRFGEGGRHRSYCEGVWSWETESIDWKTGYPQPDGSVEIDYHQGSEYQPEFGGVVRKFLRMSDEILNKGLLNKLIWHDLSLTGMAEHYSRLLCGVHLIRMQALPGKPAKITPNCFHRDGQPFTAVHLIERCNVEGGATHIAPPYYANCQLEAVPAHEITRFLLNDPLDSYIIDDAAICHYINPVICDENASVGVRTIILIDFTPLEQSDRCPQ